MSRFLGRFRETQLSRSLERMSDDFAHFSTVGCPYGVRSHDNLARYYQTNNVAAKFGTNSALECHYETGLRNIFHSHRFSPNLWNVSNLQPFIFCVPSIFCMNSNQSYLLGTSSASLRRHQVRGHSIHREPNRKKYERKTGRREKAEENTELDKNCG